MLGIRKLTFRFKIKVLGTNTLLSLKLKAKYCNSAQILPWLSIVYYLLELSLIQTESFTQCFVLVSKVCLNKKNLNPTNIALCCVLCTLYGCHIMFTENPKSNQSYLSLFRSSLTALIKIMMFYQTHISVSNYILY